jgi:hypothetical protein
MQPGMLFFGDFYHANAASSKGFHIFVVAQIGYVNTGFQGCLEHGGAFFGTYFLSVNGEGYHLILFDSIWFNPEVHPYNFEPISEHPKNCYRNLTLSNWEMNIFPDEN